MASSSIIPVVQTQVDALRFTQMEEYVASLLPVGEGRDVEGDAQSRTYLGLFLKPETIGREVSLNYLHTE